VVDIGISTDDEVAMLGTPRVYLRLDIPLDDGTRTVTVVAHEAVDFFEAGERPFPLVEDRLLELMATACRKLGMDVTPCAVVVDHLDDDQVWCDVETAEHEPIAVALGTQVRESC